ncbi:Ff.00g016790.m01.CDS01 [Fusarium sp. VM40]|nr:Ff.00g016790.m01.CDS01 [Fusarium sp. VM40]
MASLGALGLRLLAQNEPMLKNLVPVEERRAGVRAAGPSWTMALNSRGATDDVEAGEEVVGSEEVGIVVVRVVESIVDTEKDSVVGLIVDDMAEVDNFSCDVESTTDSVVWLEIEGIYEIDTVDSRSVVDVAIDPIAVSDVETLVEAIIVDSVPVDVVPVDVVSVVDRCDVEYLSTLDTEIIAVCDVVDDPHIEESESVEAIELGTERLGKADVDSDSVEDAVVADNRDSRSVLILALVESVERDVRIVEPPAVSSDVDAVLAKVGPVAEDVDPPDWEDVTVVLGKSCKVRRTII